MSARPLLVALLMAAGGVCACACACACACPCAPPPPGYRNRSGLGLYKLHWERLSWFGAKAACEREGGDLAVLRSQREAAMAQELMGAFAGADVLHVGFLDVSADGTYVTVLGEPLARAGYAVWAAGQPGHVGRELCGALGRAGGLHDVLCKRELPFLCQRPLV